MRRPWCRCAHRTPDPGRLGTTHAGGTSFVIAHRLSTIRNADQVLVLVKGQIVETVAMKSYWPNAASITTSPGQFQRQEMAAASNGHVARRGDAGAGHRAVIVQMRARMHMIRG